MSGANSDAKRVLIVCQLDRYSNGLKPVEIQRFLQERGHEVRLADTFYLSRKSRALYALAGVSALVTRGWPFSRRWLSYYLLLADYHLRRTGIGSSFTLDDFDLIICETPYDAGVLTLPTSARTLYDCPTPWADELYFEGRLTQRQHRKLRRLEKELFEHVDWLAFHWETYADYVRAQYGISGRNLMTLNFGCTPAAKRAEFNAPPRVAYLGSLSPRFIDLPLLSRLTKLYPHIDVYGGPPPDPDLGLNYLGFAPPTVLQQYQLGLVTCTQDELRREGFSAKHLDYLAHGLPTLVPAWRRHMDLLRGSVAYDEHTFLAVIDELSNEQHWRQTSDDAYTQAQHLAWDKTLHPLEDVLRDCSERTPQ